VSEEKKKLSPGKRKKNASVGNGVFENFSFSVNNGKCEVQSFGCPEKKSGNFLSWALCCKTWLRRMKVEVTIAGEN
jgi:hypothetical protein